MNQRLPYQRQGHEPRVFDLRSELYRIFGVDLTNVLGISAMTSQTILCEVGTRLRSDEPAGLRWSVLVADLT